MSHSCKFFLFFAANCKGKKEDECDYCSEVCGLGILWRELVSWTKRACQFKKHCEKEDAEIEDCSINYAAYVIYIFKTETPYVYCA